MTTRSQVLADALKEARESLFQSRIMLDQAKDALALIKRGEENEARSYASFREASNEAARKAALGAWLDNSATYLQATESLRLREQERDEATLRLEQAEDDWRAYAYDVLERVADGRPAVGGTSEQAMERLTSRIVAAILQSAQR